VKTELPLYIGEDALTRLMEFLDSHQMQRFYLVADQNTYAALGQRAQQALTDHGFDVKTIVLEGQEILADEHYIMQVLVQAGREDRVYISAGSGTITDITRFVSHRTKTVFVSLPTAPSVDGYSSGGAPLVIGGVKETIYTHPPLAIFGDLKSLCAAPRPMIASGFGDMLGKYTALADWKLGHMLWDEPYSPEIAQRAQKTLQNCVDHATEIGTASAKGIHSLMEALTDSGLCLVDFGASAPASGSEHYLSHFLELKLLREKRPAVLHGAKVGAASILVARYYEKIRQVSQEQASRLLEASSLPDRERETQRIRSAYPDIADAVIAQQAPFLDMSEADYEQLKRRIMDHWAEVQEIAAMVPPAQALIDLLRQVGGPVDFKALGFDDQEVSLALEYAHYYRNRFTAVKLCYYLGLDPFGD
jgi:glycerol-1-phosphate dehydrogenase [NAD(P)+]